MNHACMHRPIVETLATSGRSSRAGGKAACGTSHANPMLSPFSPCLGLLGRSSLHILAGEPQACISNPWPPRGEHLEKDPEKLKPHAGPDEHKAYTLSRRLGLWRRHLRHACMHAYSDACPSFPLTSTPHGPPKPSPQLIDQQRASS